MLATEEETDSVSEINLESMEYQYSDELEEHLFPPEIFLLTAVTAVEYGISSKFVEQLRIVPIDAKRTDRIPQG